MSTTGSEFIAMAKHTGPPESGADSPAERPVDSRADGPPGDSGQDFSQRFDPDLDPMYAMPPARFGRLALWAASASALTVGVAATVAYGVWFDQDQRAYTRAMATAQQALSTRVAATVPATLTAAPPEQMLSAAAAFVPDPPLSATPTTAMTTTTAAPVQTPTTWSGRVGAAAPSADSQTTLADADETAPPPSALPAQPDSSDTPSSDALAPHASSARPTMTSGSVKQIRHRPLVRAKPNTGLLARMESYFHRGNYRQHGNGSQQDQDLYAHS